MANELAEFGDRLVSIVSPGNVRTIMSKAGMAGKKSALDAAADDLGGDRRFSGMRKKTALAAGFDDAGSSMVHVNLRPKGLWMLAQDGRKESGDINPRRRGGRAVMTPQGPRARSSFKPSRGLGTLDDAERDARRSVPIAAQKAFQAACAAALGGAVSGLGSLTGGGRISGGDNS